MTNQNENTSGSNAFIASPPVINENTGDYTPEELEQIARA